MLSQANITAESPPTPSSLSVLARLNRLFLLAFSAYGTALKMHLMWYLQWLVKSLGAGVVCMNLEDRQLSSPPSTQRGGIIYPEAREILLSSVYQVFLSFYFNISLY